MDVNDLEDSVLILEFILVTEKIEVNRQYSTSHHMMTGVRATHRMYNMQYLRYRLTIHTVLKRTVPFLSHFPAVLIKM